MIRKLKKIICVFILSFYTVSSVIPVHGAVGLALTFGAFTKFAIDFVIGIGITYQTTKLVDDVFDLGIFSKSIPYSVDTTPLNIINDCETPEDIKKLTNVDTSAFLPMYNDYLSQIESGASSVSLDFSLIDSNSLASIVGEFRSKIDNISVSHNYYALSNFNFDGKVGKASIKMSDDLYSSGVLFQLPHYVLKGRNTIYGGDGGSVDPSLTLDNFNKFIQFAINEGISSIGSISFNHAMSLINSGHSYNVDHFGAMSSTTIYGHAYSPVGLVSRYRKGGSCYFFPSEIYYFVSGGNNAVDISRSTLLGSLDPSDIEKASNIWSYSITANGNDIYFFQPVIGNKDTYNYQPFPFIEGLGVSKDLFVPTGFQTYYSGITSLPEENISVRQNVIDLNNLSTSKDLVLGVPSVPVSVGSIGVSTFPVNSDYVKDKYPIVFPVVDAGNVGIIDIPLGGDVVDPDIPSDGILGALNNILSTIKSIPNTIIDFFTAQPTTSLDFSPLELSLVDKFPFCLPFDLYNAFNSFIAKPEVPKFNINFDEGLVGSGGFTFDFSPFSKIASILRYFILIIFVTNLIKKTRDMIGG